jgi:hypothetical protein
MTSPTTTILRERGEAVIGSYYRPTIALEEIGAANWSSSISVTSNRFVDLSPRRAKPTHLVLATAVGDHRRQREVNLFEADKGAPRAQRKLGSCRRGGLLFGGVRAKLGNVPISEETAMLPHPYGVNKVAQDLLTF